MVEKFAKNKSDAAKSSPSKLDVVKDETRQLYKNLEVTMTELFIEDQFNFCWRSTLDIPKSTRGTIDLHSIYRNKHSVNPKNQLVNHFPNIKCLTTKSGLLKYTVKKFIGV